MGRKIFIDEGDQGTITEICWMDKEGDIEGIKIKTNGNFQITSAGGGTTILFKEDLPKIRAAIDKAIELKWHLEGE